MSCDSGNRYDPISKKEALRGFFFYGSRIYWCKRGGGVTFYVGICGYGNLGRGVEAAVAAAPDAALAAVFTRRDPGAVFLRTPGVPVIPVAEASEWQDRIDVMILCGGSAADLPVQTPALASYFTLVDSFDTHEKIPAHFVAVDAAARRAGKLAIISAGWDPGLFSLFRLYAAAVLPEGNSYTFWGRGVSQGHSDALRRIPGVTDAREYTIPSASALEAVRRGEEPAEKLHVRDCYVVPEDGANLRKIEEQIVNMPHYFKGYDTSVHFITAEEMCRDHAALPHGGTVLRIGQTGGDAHLMECCLRLDSNPAFTGGVLLAYARAACRLAARGESGCRTPLDIPPAFLSPLPPEELLTAYL